MEESINKFLDYCERTGERPKKANIDGKECIVEWYPNKMLKRIYWKRSGDKETELLYYAKLTPYRCLR